LRGYEIHIKGAVTPSEATVSNVTAPTKGSLILFILVRRSGKDASLLGGHQKNLNKSGFRFGAYKNWGFITKLVIV
jgi:hypothetical protein